MTFFDASDVADFADLVAEASPDSGTIQRYAGSADDGHGGRTDVWSDVETVPVKVASFGGAAERSETGGIVGFVNVEITVPSGTDIKNNDRIEVTPDGGGDPFVYEVVGVPPARSWEARRRVLARAVT